MRPLVHPSIEAITSEGILHALADPVRMAIYAEIVDSDSSLICSNSLRLTAREIPKSTLSQHFRILRGAGLIRSERRGEEMRNTSRSQEIDGRLRGLIAAIIEAHNVQSERARRAAKARKR